MNEHDRVAKVAYDKSITGQDDPRCSLVTVKRLVASGDLPSIKAGKLRRVRRADLAKWNGTG